MPGGYVYYMMSALVLNKLSTMRHYGQLTAEWAFGLAAGIGLIAVLHQIASWKPREKHGLYYTDFTAAMQERRGAKPWEVKNHNSIG